MKLRERIPWGLVALALAAGGWFSLDRCFASRDARASAEAALRELREAGLLAARHGVGSGLPRQAIPLKSLVQESAQASGVAVAFLAENERPLGKGLLERHVTMRLARPAHAKLVEFLGSLEDRGAGARVKEIHLKPSKDATALYEEAEVVLARTSREGSAKP